MSDDADDLLKQAAKNTRFNDCQHVAAGADVDGYVLIEKRLWLVGCRVCKECRLGLIEVLQGQPFGAKPRKPG